MRVKSCSAIGMIFSILLITSCHTSSNIQWAFVRKANSMEYLMDKKVRDKSNLEILLRVRSKDPMLKDSEVSIKSWYIIPLLIYNQYTGKYELKAGEDALVEEPKSFIAKKIIEQSKTNCNHNLTNRSYSPTYILNIEVDTIISTHQIKSRDLLVPGSYFSGIEWDITAKESFFFTKIKYELTTPKGEVIHRGFVENTIQPKDVIYTDFAYNFNYDITTMAAEYVGLSLKQNIEDIIKEINQLSLD